MENKGLLFIPDISGFTKFVNRVDIEHGRLIIQELLEIIVNANQIGLEISEIEGDAILFYKYGTSPDMDSLYRQVEKMFCDFHKSLLSYDLTKYCQCNACVSAKDLTLKVITHYGEFMDYKVKDFKKLIGKDIIVAHQLLKNDIDQHEYWLVTNDLISNTPRSLPDKEIHWNASTKKTDEGEINYQYARLTELKNKVHPEEILSDNITQYVKLISASREFDTDIITLFRSAGMFEYRHRWQEGVLNVEELSHYLPRVGMKCRYIRENGEEIIYSKDYSFSPERISFTETNEKLDPLIHYLVESVTDQRTRLTIEYFYKKNLLRNTLFNLTDKKKMESSLERSFDKMEQLLKVIEFPY